MKIGILTSGGDAPGMNAAIRASARMALYRNCEPYLVYNGFNGLIHGGELIFKCSWHELSILSSGGTAIGTSRCEEMKTRKGMLCAAENMIRLGIHSLVIIGGDGSLTGANVLKTEWASLIRELVDTRRIEKTQIQTHEDLLVVGMVGSIDNDVVGTDLTIGADTSLHRIIEAVDAISTSALSHKRAFVVEVMGRNCGWLALMSAIACEADWVLVPEQPSVVGQWEDEMCACILKNKNLGKKLTIVIVSEGALDSECNPITSYRVNQVINDRLRLNSKVTVLGHVQRGGRPSAIDRLIGSLQGVHAIEFLLKADQSQDKQSVLIGIHENGLCYSSLEDAISKTKKVDQALKSKNFKRAFELRDPDFQETYTIKYSPPPSLASVQHRIAIVNMGAPSGGTNSAVHSIVRHLLYLGHVPIGFYNGFSGILGSEDNIQEMKWDTVNGWTGMGGSMLGTSRYALKPSDLEKLSNIISKYAIKGLVVVGGYDVITAFKVLQKGADVFPSLSIPMVHIPATVSNNVPGTEYSLGSDTALNVITNCCDSIRQSASSTRRAFIIVVQGGNCGYLSLVGGLVAGASYSYIPEEPISLADVVKSCAHLTKRFEEDDKTGRLVLFGENASKTYSPEVLEAIFTQEAAGLFRASTCKLGHLLQGGQPSPRDRILGFKLAILAISHVLKEIEAGKGCCPGILCIFKGSMTFSTLESLEGEMDDERRAPVHPWWFQYQAVAKILAKQEVPSEHLDLDNLVTFRPLN